MFERNLQYVLGANPLTTFDENGYAQNPGPIPENQPGNAFNAKDFRNIMITIVGTGEVTVFGSIQQLPPDFSDTQTITNTYAAIVLADYSLQNTYYDGVVTVSGETKIVELNTNGLTWFGILRDNEDVQIIVTVTDNI